MVLVCRAMPYASNRDRAPGQLELEQVTWPVPPLNLFLTSGYSPGVFDLVWDDPSSLALNARFCIFGVNIYRSFDSEFGPYDRITDLLLGSTFWRDQTDNVLEVDEVVSEDRWVLRGVCSASELNAPRYVFRVERWPIVRPGSQAVPESDPSAIQVWVDGVQARVLRVDGTSGEVELDVFPYPDVITQSLGTPVIPGDSSVVTVTYRYNRSLLRTDLAQRVFYRVTTVGVPRTLPLSQVQSTDLVETPLEQAAFTSNAEIEKLDYIWREAVRRNQWILAQGGERVKVFLRKVVGQSCPCNQKPPYKQPLNDCTLCFSSGILGGFEGPYDMILAPDDAERRITQKDSGRTLEHSYEVWTGPRPLLSQRDFLVKINGERYSIGPVRMPTNRGMVLQQHFNIGHLDEKDILYRVPVDDLHRFVADQLAPMIPPENPPALPTDKVNIPKERQLKGRSMVWENITW